MQRLSAGSHVLRNLVAWALCLAAYCVIDYFYVRHGPATVAWAESLFIPMFFGAILFANRGLFPAANTAVSRWFAIGMVSILIACVGGFVLITLGVWFHFSIGGSL